MSPCNHSNFPGALWQTDNRVREELLFSSSPLPPSLPLFFPPSHLFSLPFLSWAVCWILASYGIFLLAAALSSSSSALFFFLLPFMCALKFPSPAKAAPDNCCHNCLLSMRATFMDSQNCLRTLFLYIQRGILHWHREKCAPKALSQPVIPLSTFQRLCCQTMVLPLRPIGLRICNA